MKTLLKTLIAIGLAIGLVFLYTWAVGQEGSLIGSSYGESTWYYFFAMTLIAYLIYQLVIDKIFKKKKKQD